ncbi:uncharacterized protein CYBJADRAFT_56507 [Cyberlindnera jadinii NRRL Y-1542]|uniref:Uncharacterized protein n=1 Tax=Cyberlindnera jadinii (strain ATCC 18201 / CBS 1600 / BCRC 20928 / JCM 3617 / NBRC 0987 / NRRL Y-1542) TaxID=983966 RepID=A0A1E4RU14_CYBJN|nr:hypothetical protein CYBJADRAFT_56507 [Cyberlindnera jadinii NRRL Y-1542]ODV70762.1 hypothetical protein CYBJADRAFT_56507 [Cyberlindnera jadinii NRRL Y-1542]
MTQNQYSFIHRIKNITEECPRTKDQAKETSTANPEPQRQAQTNGEQDTEPRNLQVLSENTHSEITDVLQQPLLPEAELDNGTLTDRIRDR